MALFLTNLSREPVKYRWWAKKQSGKRSKEWFKKYVKVKFGNNEILIEKPRRRYKLVNRGRIKKKLYLIEFGFVKRSMKLSIWSKIYAIIWGDDNNRFKLMLGNLKDCLGIIKKLMIDH